MEKDAQFFQHLVEMQLNAKFRLIRDLLKEINESSLNLIPEHMEVIRDSRGEPLDLRFINNQPKLVGQLTLLLWLDEMAENTGADSAASLFDSTFQPVMDLLKADETAGQWGTLLEQGVGLDLMCQLFMRPNLDSQQKAILAHALEIRADRIIRIAGTKPKIVQLDKVGAVGKNKDKLASYGSIIQALSRLSETELNVVKDEYIAHLVADFDDEFWNEKLGIYHGNVKRYNSREMLINTYQLSELDITLTLSSLARGLKMMDKGKGYSISQHLYQFGKQMLVSPELTTIMLNKMMEDSKQFDLEILQDVDIQGVEYETPYAGDVLRYTIHVYNRCRSRQANQTLENVLIKDTLPDEVSYLSGTTQIDGSWSEDPANIGSDLQWNIDRVDDHTTISFAVLVSPEYDERNLRNRVQARVDVGGSRRNRYCDFSNETIDPIGSSISSLKVLYYNDSNMNVTYDSEENELYGIPTILTTDRGETRSTDGNFEKLKPGVYTVSPDWRNSDYQFLPTVKTPVKEVIREGEEKQLGVGMLDYGQVEGWVFEDYDGDGKKAKGEPGLAGVKVQISGQSDFYGYSARDGYFKIERIPHANQKRVELASGQIFYNMNDGVIPSIQLMQTD